MNILRIQLRTLAFTLTVTALIVIGFIMAAGEILLHWKWNR